MIPNRIGIQSSVGEFSNGPPALYQWCPCAKGTKAKAPRITYLRRIRGDDDGDGDGDVGRDG